MPFAAGDTPDAEEFEDLIDSLAAGTGIARGRRTTTSSTTTTEVGVLRLTASVRAGRAYMISTSPLRLNSTVSDDRIYAIVRHTTNGTTPSVASTPLHTITALMRSSVPSLPMLFPYVASTDHTLGLLLCVGRWTGTGTVSIVTDASMPTIDLTVVDLGVDPGDTGVDI